MGEFWLDTTTGHGLVEIDASGIITAFSVSASRLLGWDRAAAIGRSFHDLVVPERFRERTTADLALIVAGEAPELLGRTVRAAVLNAAGEEHSVSVTLLETGEPPSRFVLCLSADGGYLLRRDAQMDVSGLWMVDTELELLDATQRFWRMHGRAAAPDRCSLQQYVDDYVHPDDRELLLERRDLRSSGQEVAGTVSWRVVLPGGEVRSLKSETATFFGPDGALERMMGITTDVTDVEGTHRSLIAHRAVDAAVAGWDGPRGGVAGLLRTVATAMAWPGAAMWRLDPGAGMLDCPVLWRAAGDHPGLPSEAAMRAERLRVGLGLIGRAWSTGEVVRGGSEESEVAVPVARSGRPLAVLQFHLAPGEVVSEELEAALTDIGRGPLADCFARHLSDLGLSPLTDREQQVLQMAADGGAINAIAERLGISSSTVKTHFEHIYEKLGVSDRGGAVAEGFRQGLVS